jgi:hypothetical protein
MLKDLDLKQVIKLSTLGTKQTPVVCFKYKGANKCAFNFTNHLEIKEGETLQEFLDETWADIDLEEWSNKDGEVQKNFTVRCSVN